MKKLIFSFLTLLSVQFSSYASSSLPIDFLQLPVQVNCATFTVTLDLVFVQIEGKIRVCCWYTRPGPYYGVDCTVDVLDMPNLGGEVTVEQFLNALCQQYNVNCGQVNSVAISNSSTESVNDENEVHVGNFKVKSQTYTIDKETPGYSIPVELEVVED